jgi:hypothetical protein
MKFIGAMDAIGPTNRPNFFIFGRFFRFFVQEQLYRALDIITIFPTGIIGIPLYRLHDLFLELGGYRFTEGKLAKTKIFPLSI